MEYLVILSALGISGIIIAIYLTKRLEINAQKDKMLNTQETRLEEVSEKHSSVILKIGIFGGIKFGFGFAIGIAIASLILWLIGIVMFGSLLFGIGQGLSN